MRDRDLEETYEAIGVRFDDAVELLARLAALVPAPRVPLVIYHGVLAPHSKWRTAVVPKPPGVVHANQ